MAKSRLWSNTTSDRQFLIPDSALPPAGTFELRTKLGERQLVDEASIAEYEVSAEEAAAWAKSELEKVLEEAGRRLENRRSKGRPRPSLSLLIELTGESSQDLHADPRALGRGLKKLGDELLSVIKAGLSSDAAEVTEAQATLDRLRQTLDRHDPARGAGSERAQRGSGANASPDDDPQRAERLSKLAGLAQSLAQMSETAGKRFAAAAEELRQARERPTEKKKPAAPQPPDGKRR